MNGYASLFLIGALVLLQAGCDQNEDFAPPESDEAKIENIAQAPTVNPVAIQNIPEVINDYLLLHHTHMNIEMVYHANGEGYEVFMENGMCVFFDEHGNHLDHDGMHGDAGNHHGGGDHGINMCLTGDTLSIETMPGLAMEYLTTHFPGANIVTLVIKHSGRFGVELSSGEILIFEHDGNFLHACENEPSGGHGHDHGMHDGSGWHCEAGGMGGHGHMGNWAGVGEHHWGGMGISIEETPTAVITYVTENYPDGTILHVTQTYHGNYFLRLEDCVRLVFDENGMILFDSGG